MDTIRLGIVGFGGMGVYHARYLKNGDVPGVEVAAACDIDPERLRAAKEMLGDDVQVFDDAGALFDAASLTPS